MAENYVCNQTFSETAKFQSDVCYATLMSYKWSQPSLNAALFPSYDNLHAFICHCLLVHWNQEVSNLFLWISLTLKPLLVLMELNNPYN
jgi:hypothetical protein